MVSDCEIAVLYLLNEVDKINKKKLYGIISKEGSVQSIINKSSQKLEQYGFSKTEIRILEKIGKRDKELDKKIEEIKRAKKNNIKIITILDEDYPKMLIHLRDLPLILFLKGSLPNLEKTIAIVGTRNASYFGRSIARILSKALAREFVIISGMARGIDTEAHIGALEGNGKTIAVLGWIDTIYPKDNQELSKDIIKHGCIISERYAKPKNVKNALIKRNRIISALSLGIVVIEVGDKSGAYHAVETAKKLNRTIFVIKPSEEYLKEERRASKGYIKMKEKYNAIELEIDLENIDETLKFIKRKLKITSKLDELVIA